MLHITSKPLIRIVMIIIASVFIEAACTSCSEATPLPDGISVTADNSPAPSATVYSGPDFIDDGNGPTCFVEDFSAANGFNSDDYVPDAQAAYHLAVIYLGELYGGKAAEAQKPLHIAYDDDKRVWFIHGTAASDTGGNDGYLALLMQKKDGMILWIATLPEGAQPTESPNHDGDMVDDGKISLETLALPESAVAYGGDAVPNAKTAYDIMGVCLSQLQGDNWLRQRPFRVCYDADRGMWYLHGTVNACQIEYVMKKTNGQVMLIGLDAD